ncbi:MAG: glycosyltransferase [Crocinitomicaceae bacterium]
MYPSEIKDKTIIIAPLDWGMGHATRCIPLIHQLIEQNNTVVFAGTELQISLIVKDFPEITCEAIQGYNVSLDSGKPTYLQMISQFGKLKTVIREEQEIAEQLVKKYKADVVISDNRYGFRSNSTLCIIMTHQLEVPLPVLKQFVNKRIRRHIEQFNICWIPDNEMGSYCGEMVVPSLKIPKLFIGLLSRFKPEVGENVYHYLVIISGPEPERSVFARKVIQLANNSQKKIGIVAPFDLDYAPSFTNPSTKELNQLINQSKTIISRAGYTTIMEMITLEKKAILIPTKGQFEQEYLAKTVRSEYLKFCELSNIQF